MNTNKRIAVAAAVVFLVVLTFLSGRFQPDAKDTADQPSTPPAEGTVEQNDEPKATDDPRITRLADGRTVLNASADQAKQLYQDADPQRDLEIVADILTHYLQVFREKPFGSENTEILAQLLGENPKRIAFLSPDSPALSSQNELLDRWGSPFIFHPLTTEAMDIRSVGPDQILWTDDDLSLPFETLEKELQLQPGEDRI
ncbi:hypothetical protein [Roseibacillus persicicus]|uniref:hypothetical protein n=1 Tax=Roseibacillus persicicus TaxID=454148 RepID=UPI00280F651B|nr:hypothetical protein [Roseibacillus persicicus]MDQ8189468.1 hypothetical protein [Roseibacillus persicicus]